MGIVIGSPLQQGALATRRDDEVAAARWLSKPRREQFLALSRLLDEIGIPLPELALRFVVSNKQISCTLSGARSADEIEWNTAAVSKGPLPRDIMNRLDEIAARATFRPCEEPFFLPFGRDYLGPGPAR